MPPPGFGAAVNNTRLVARSPLRPSSPGELARRLAAQERLVERLAQFYAATFEVAELRQIGCRAAARGPQDGPDRAYIRLPQAEREGSGTPQGC